MKNLVWTFAGIIFLLGVWELGSIFYDSSLILPSPFSVLGRFFDLVRTSRFLAALGGTFVRVLGGIGIAVPLGLAAGIACGLDSRVKAFLKPFFSVVSATPVMAVILIAFLFLGPGRTTVFTAFLMIFPVISANAIEGIDSTDSRLIELFAAFKMSRSEALRYLYIPSLAPFILGGLKSSLSLCWKVVVAAEIIVQPFNSLGAGMQQAKAHLETTELFAWTVATVIAASLTQGILSLAVKKLGVKR